MSWLSSLGVALLAAVVGGVGAGLVAAVLTHWLRTTNFEGTTGFAIVGFGLLGAMGGFVIGLVCARMVAAGVSPGFVKALGTAVGVIGGLMAVALGIGWLTADASPRIDGRELMLEVEVRFPPAISMPGPSVGDPYLWHVTLTSMSGSRRQTLGNLHLRQAALVEGRNIVPASVSLTTSDPLRSLGVGCGDNGTQYFDLSLPAKPTRADLEWSAWLTAPHTVNLSPVSKDKAVAVRYRVRLDDAGPGG